MIDAEPVQRSVLSFIFRALGWYYADDSCVPCGNYWGVRSVDVVHWRISEILSEEWNTPRRHWSDGSRFNKVDVTLRVTQPAFRGPQESSLGE